MYNSVKIKKGGKLFMTGHNQKECEEFIMKLQTKVREIIQDFDKLSYEDKKYIFDLYKKFLLINMSFR